MPAFTLGKHFMSDSYMSGKAHASIHSGKEGGLVDGSRAPGKLCEHPLLTLTTLAFRFQFMPGDMFL